MSELRHGGCHCGAVRFELRLHGGLESRRRSNPDELGVNVACLDRVSPFDFDSVPVTDGTRHPSDSGLDEAAPDAGVLRYELA